MQPLLNKEERRENKITKARGVKLIKKHKNIIKDMGLENPGQYQGHLEHLSDAQCCSEMGHILVDVEMSGLLFQMLPHSAGLS